MGKGLLKTEEAIAFVKEIFTGLLSEKLKLHKVSSPLVVLDGTGINDDLSGVERAVSFPVKALQEKRAVVVHSLAKWKRIRLKDFEIEEGVGILTDMKALRPDEDYSHLHSIYVDQWDWEVRMAPKQRTLFFLKATVDRIYDAILETEKAVHLKYSEIKPSLPKSITYIHSEELLLKYPNLTSKQREYEAAKEYGAIFLIGIGKQLSSGEPHDGRAPDYDDWSTLNEDGYIGLNGDIIVWHPELQEAVELSSMGIRVNKQVMKQQLKERKCEERSQFMYHRMILEESLPQSIGGGIGQSRLCIFLLKRKHIGEVQVSIWSDEQRDSLQEKGVFLL